MIKVNMINVFFMQVSRFLHLLQGISGLLRGSERVKTQNISCKIYTCKFNSNRAVTCGYCRYAISNNGIMFLKSNLLAKKVRCLKTVSYC